MRREDRHAREICRRVPGTGTPVCRKKKKSPQEGKKEGGNGI
jgi:hypothetical protein